MDFCLENILASILFVFLFIFHSREEGGYFSLFTAPLYVPAASCVFRWHMHIKKREARGPKCGNLNKWRK